jgi:hypothetical protein
MNLIIVTQHKVINYVFILYKHLKLLEADFSKLGVPMIIETICVLDKKILSVCNLKKAELFMFTR